MCMPTELAYKKNIRGASSTDLACARSPSYVLFIPSTRYASIAVPFGTAKQKHIKRIEYPGSKTNIRPPKFEGFYFGLDDLRFFN